MGEETEDEGSSNQGPSGPSECKFPTQTVPPCRRASCAGTTAVSCPPPTARAERHSFVSITCQSEAQT